MSDQQNTKNANGLDEVFFDPVSPRTEPSWDVPPLEEEQQDGKDDNQNNGQFIHPLAVAVDINDQSLDKNGNPEGIDNEEEDEDDEDEDDQDQFVIDPATIPRYTPYLLEIMTQVYSNLSHYLILQQNKDNQKQSILFAQNQAKMAKQLQPQRGVGGGLRLLSALSPSTQIPSTPEDTNHNKAIFVPSQIYLLQYLTHLDDLMELCSQGATTFMMDSSNQDASLTSTTYPVTVSIITGLLLSAQLSFLQAEHITSADQTKPIAKSMPLTTKHLLSLLFNYFSTLTKSPPALSPRQARPADSTIYSQQYNVVLFNTLLMHSLKFSLLPPDSKSKLLFHSLRSITAPLLIKFMTHNNTATTFDLPQFAQYHSAEQNPQLNCNAPFESGITLDDQCFPMLLTIIKTLKQLSPSTPLNTLLSESLKQRLGTILGAE